MELKRKLKKVAASALALTMGFSIGISAVGCDGLQGQRQLQEFIANSASMDTEYFVGETVDFAGLVLQAKYNDNTTQDINISEVVVKLGGEIITQNLGKITESAGTKNVELVFEDKTVTITIEVKATNDSSNNGEEVKYYVAMYTAPKAIVDRTKKINNAGQAYGSEKYESTFYQAEEKEVIVGDDNTYKFLPVLETMPSVIDDEVVDAMVFTNFETNTKISIYQEDAYVALERVEGEEQITYSLGGVVYATETIGKNEYDFAAEAVGKKFKLEVLPDDCFIDPNSDEAWATPVSVEIKVVDAFNVYTAKQLSILENVDSNWDSIKFEMGVTAEMVASVKGIVLQNDISVTASDIPSSYTYTLDKEILYGDATDPANPVIKTAQEWGLTNTFLKEAEETIRGALERKVTEGQTFDVHGNYYLLDLSKLPLVSSITAAEGNTVVDGYGNDFSNATFIRFSGEETSKGTVTVKNLDSICNANRSQLCTVNKDGAVDTNRPVYAGGIIFMKMGAVNITLDNVIGRTSFISYFPEEYANVTMNNIKMFDSYQSAMMVWGAADVNITNSTMERAGGPLFLMQHAYLDNNDLRDKSIPKVTVDAASSLKNPVTGEEAWFYSVGASEKVGQIKALGAAFAQIGKSLMDKDGKLGLIAVVMPAGNGVDILTDTRAQGRFIYGNYVIDRMADATENPLRAVYDSPAMPVEGAPSLLNAGAAIFNTTYQAIGVYDGTSFGLLNDAMAPVFAASEYITMNQLGLGLMLTFHNAQ